MKPYFPLFFFGFACFLLVFAIFCYISLGFFILVTRIGPGLSHDLRVLVRLNICGRLGGEILCNIAEYGLDAWCRVNTGHDERATAMSMRVCVCVCTRVFGCMHIRVTCTNLAQLVAVMCSL